MRVRKDDMLRAFTYAYAAPLMRQASAPARAPRLRCFDAAALMSFIAGRLIFDTPLTFFTMPLDTPPMLLLCHADAALCRHIFALIRCH